MEYVDVVRKHVLKVAKDKSETMCARKYLLNSYFDGFYRMDEEALKDIAGEDIESGGEELAAEIFRGLGRRCEPQYYPLSI